MSLSLPPTSHLPPPGAPGLLLLLRCTDSSSTCVRQVEFEQFESMNITHTHIQRHRHIESGSVGLFLSRSLFSSHLLLDCLLRAPMKSCSSIMPSLSLALALSCLRPLECLRATENRTIVYLQCIPYIRYTYRPRRLLRLTPRELDVSR